MTTKTKTIKRWILMKLEGEKKFLIGVPSYTKKGIDREKKKRENLTVGKLTITYCVPKGKKK